jgi:PadR family transcriptional regulator PadR
MPTGPRMTLPTQLVLEVLLTDAAGELYGGEIGELAGLRSGTVHPILARLEGIGWLRSRWEDIDPRTEGRPPRRYYRLTADGVHAAHRALARAHRPSPARRLRPQVGEA